MRRLLRKLDWSSGDNLIQCFAGASRQATDGALSIRRRIPRSGLVHRRSHGVSYIVPMEISMRLVVLMIASAAAVMAQPSLDFEFFKTRVQPIFLARREGHARCYACHSIGTPYRLQRLSPGASTWNDEQSRKNFEATVE